MHAEQDWIEAYKELCTIIKAGVTEVQHIDMWYEQIFNQGEEYPFPTHSIFLEFNADSIVTNGKKVQDMNMLITFYHAFDTLSDTYHTSENQETALEFGLVNRKLHKKLQALEGTHFSSLNRVGFRHVPVPEQALICYAQTYSCIIRDYAAADEPSMVTIGSLELSAGNAPTNQNMGIFNVEMD